MDAFFRMLRGGAACFASLLIWVAFSVGVSAQVTPNELSRLSIEELLGVEIEDIQDEKRWFLSYEFRYLDIGRYQSGTDKLTFDEVQFLPGETRTNSNYPIVPTFIEQKVHAFSLGREITDEMSISVTVPYVMQQTKHISFIAGFEEFEIESSDVGDISLLGQYRFLRAASSHASFGLGISFPVGSIKEIGDTPRGGAGTLEQLPYTMQIGSGTYDFIANLAYEKDTGQWALGIKGSATLRTGKNDSNYRLGNNYGIELTTRFKGWSLIRPGLNVSLRTTEAIHGRDESLLIPGVAFPFGASITDPANFGGEKAKLGGNIRVCLQDACTINLNVRAAFPFYQNLNGIQPRERFSVSTALNYSF